jgi:hypothetical protein
VTLDTLVPTPPLTPERRRAAAVLLEGEQGPVNLREASQYLADLYRCAFAYGWVAGAAYAGRLPLPDEPERYYQQHVAPLLDGNPDALLTTSPLTPGCRLPIAEAAAVLLVCARLVSNHDRIREVLTACVRVHVSAGFLEGARTHEQPEDQDEQTAEVLAGLLEQVTSDGTLDLMAPSLHRLTPKAKAPAAG